MNTTEQFLETFKSLLWENSEILEKEGYTKNGIPTATFRNLAKSALRGQMDKQVKSKEYEDEVEDIRDTVPNIYQSFSKKKFRGTKGEVVKAYTLLRETYKSLSHDNIKQVVKYYYKDIDENSGVKLLPNLLKDYELIKQILDDQETEDNNASSLPFG